ncbi:hypothetical protein Aperf_G00000104516 [Anoplocephala perfoliata]
MERRLPEYPLSELHRARNAFADSWQRTLTNSSTTLACQESRVVRRINQLHRSHPVDVFMINCEEYPFIDEDAYNPPTSLLIRRPKRLRPGEDTKTVQAKKRRVEKSSYSKTIYRCDGCDEAGELIDEDAAINHLLESGHSSCSQYRLISSGENAEEEEGAALEELISPRSVVVPTGEGKINSGWHEGDTVVCCPECHLIFPDKILCSHHHMTQHPGRQSVYCLARVLKVIDANLSMHNPVCEKCHNTSPNLIFLFAHWYRISPACCPFPTYFDKPQHLEVECVNCNRLRDETLYPGKDINLADVVKNTVNAMVNHMHNAHGSEAEGHLRLRCVQVETSGKKKINRSVLPPLSSAFRSPSASLQFTLNEKEREAEIVCRFRGRGSRQILKEKIESELERLRKAAFDYNIRGMDG